MSKLFPSVNRKIGLEKFVKAIYRNLIWMDFVWGYLGGFCLGLFR